MVGYKYEFLPFLKKNIIYYILIKFELIYDEFIFIKHILFCHCVGCVFKIMNEFETKINDLRLLRPAPTPLYPFSIFGE